MPIPFSVLQSMILHPLAAFRAASNRFNHAHVGNGIFDGRWHNGVVQYCLRKHITLQGILVAGIQQDFLYLVAVLVPDFTWPVRWSVERYLYFDSTLRAKDVDPLVGCQLGRAGKCRGTLSKSSIPEAMRSVLSCGSYSTMPDTRCGSAPKIKRDSDTL